MARRKNVKRIDPRYFLHETVNRDKEEEEDDVLEEEEDDVLKNVFSVSDKKKEEIRRQKAYADAVTRGTLRRQPRVRRSDTDRRSNQELGEID